MSGSDADLDAKAASPSQPPEWTRSSAVDWGSPGVPTLSPDLVRGDTPDLECPFGVYSIMGPMYAGKSTHILSVAHAYFEKGWGVVTVRFSGDTRDGGSASHIETHTGAKSPMVSLSCRLCGLFGIRGTTLKEVSAKVTSIQSSLAWTPQCPAKWVVLIDEGQFFARRNTPTLASEMWELAHSTGAHVWIACLNVDRDLAPWAATRNLASRSVWCRQLYATCAMGGCQRSAWCTHLVGSETTSDRGSVDAIAGADKILIDTKNRTAPMYEPRCTEHMPKLCYLYGRVPAKQSFGGSPLNGWAYLTFCLLPLFLLLVISPPDLRCDLAGCCEAEIIQRVNTPEFALGAVCHSSLWCWAYVICFSWATCVIAYVWGALAYGYGPGLG